MFLNKCLLFKEIQLHLKQFSTCKESVQAVGKVASLSEQLQGFLIKESSSGLFSSPSASPGWMMNPWAGSVKKTSLFYTLTKKKLCKDWFCSMNGLSSATLSKAFRSCLETSEQTPKIRICTHGCTCTRLVRKEQCHLRRTEPLAQEDTRCCTAVEQWSLWNPLHYILRHLALPLWCLIQVVLTQCSPQAHGKIVLFLFNFVIRSPIFFKPWEKWKALGFSPSLPS